MGPSAFAIEAVHPRIQLGGHFIGLENPRERLARFNPPLIAEHRIFRQQSDILGKGNMASKVMLGSHRRRQAWAHVCSAIRPLVLAVRAWRRFFRDRLPGTPSGTVRLAIARCPDFSRHGEEDQKPV
jgi:hypothetical protein